MPTRHLYVVRHGSADPFGELTQVGRRQTELLAERLAGLPVQAVWHSPLARAEASARIIGSRARASEILNRKRRLTLDMIRAISTEWKLPIETLTGAYELAREHA